MNCNFDPQEYTARRAKATQMLEQFGLDVLLITAEANINYFSGYQPWVSWTTFTRPTILLLMKRSDPVLIVQDVWLGAAHRESDINDIRGYSRLSQIPVEIISEILTTSRLTNGRIGAELGYEQRMGISSNDFTLLKNAFPKCTFEDASELLWKLRIIKSPAETECIRKACAGTFRVFENGFDSIAEGFTEIEVVQAFRRAAAAINMEIGFIIPVMGPSNYRAMTSRPTNRKLERGEMVWVDLSLIYGDYRSDFSRAAVVGGPSDKQKRIWEDAHHVTMKGIERMAPGVPIKEIVVACSEEASRRGLNIGTFSTGRLGHGIGLMTTEPPHISSYDTTVLAPGMVLAIEPGIISDDGVFVPEQDVVITNNGYDILTDGFWDLKTIRTSN